MTLYRVKFLYCVTVEASSASAAHNAVCKQIKEHPHSVIATVEDARYAQHRPLWKQLLKG